jgi:hypothetical protein
MVLKEEDTKVVLEVDMGMVMDKDMKKGEVDPPLVSIVEKLVMYVLYQTSHSLCILLNP